jgi:quercetin dioxygenase-like cupin family protein
MDFFQTAGKESLIKNAPSPYTIVRATQSFEFLRGIAQAAISRCATLPKRAGSVRATRFANLGTSLVRVSQIQRRRRPVKKTALLLAAAAALFARSVVAQQTVAQGANVSVVFDQELPNVPAKSMRVVLVEYAPGAGSPSHRHPPSAFIYARVLEGAIRSKVNDEPERTYKAGESWTEKPGDHHQVSHNASNTEPAKLLAIFVVDTSDREIVIPDK